LSYTAQVKNKSWSSLFLQSESHHQLHRCFSICPQR